jgi:hypothetical protein
MDYDACGHGITVPLNHSTKSTATTPRLCPYARFRDREGRPF